MKTALFLSCASCLFLLVPSSGPAQAPSAVEQITSLAANSTCARVQWKNRGLAPAAYMRGIALVYARAVCHPERSDIQVVSKARLTPGPEANKTDALTWYDSRFTAAGMSNAANGIDTLRHAYTLLIGLGMRESSGKYCEGRDTSMDFTTADSAEAGIFQTSFKARLRQPTMSELYEKYKADQSGCLLDVFKHGVSCHAGDAVNFGEGEGVNWQQLTKTCPAFATEYAAVLIRVHGGRTGEFGPLRNHAAEIQPVCDAMFKEIENLVRANPQMCAAL